MEGALFDDLFIGDVHGNAPEGYPDGLVTQDGDNNLVAPVQVGGAGVHDAD